MRRYVEFELPAAMFVILACARSLPAQTAADQTAATPAATESTLDIVIPDEPKTIDPATLVPERLAQPATVEFADASLNEVVQWLRDDQKLSTIVDAKALEAEGISLAEPVTDRLDNEPLYLLLNRLRTIDVDWTYRGGVLRLTTKDAADDDIRTQPYPVGDLFDAGYDPDSLIDSVTSMTDGAWTDIDGIGGDIRVLGDVLFVQNTDSIHRKVTGLLAALRQHARRTHIWDEPAHFEIRERLSAPVSVDLDNAPLTQVLSDLAGQSGIDIRIDIREFREHRIREREPVSLVLADQPLRLVLQSILSPLELDWVLRDRVLWITTADAVEESRKAAVFDVRDLCRNRGESNSLLDAITSQTTGPWEVADGIGGVIAFPIPGTMAVLQTEDQMDSVLQLLEDYRVALRGSKRRARPGEGPDAIITRYYRLPTRIATDIAPALPRLIQPGTWQDVEHPQANGTIVLLASGTSLLDTQGNPVVAAQGNKATAQQALVVEHSVLIIKQTRAIHDEIAELINKIEHGDQYAGAGGGMGGMGGFGGGGFGGGFFSTGDREASAPGGAD